MQCIIKCYRSDSVWYVNASVSFSWTKDGEPLTLSEDSVNVLADNGTLIIVSPGPDDEGLYQCFAETMFGIAASVSFELRHACKSALTSTHPSLFAQKFAHNTSQSY